MLNEDAPFYLMKLIEHGRMLCEHFRYSVFLFQWIPVLTLKAGVSIAVLTRIYSLTFEIFYLALFLFSFYILKNTKGAIMILLFLCVALGRDFFLPINEYVLAIISTLLLVGLTFSNSLVTEKRKTIWSVIIILVSINFHPIAFLALAYIISYEFLETEKIYKKHWLILALSAILIFAIRNWLVPMDEYEHNKMKSWSNVFGYLFNPSGLSSATSAIKYFSIHFPELILLFFISSAILISQKKWLVLSFSAFYSYSVIILFSVIRGADETNFWYAEYFILLGIPALLPLAKNLPDLRKFKIVFPLLISTLIVIFIFRIKTNLGYFQSRINYVERLIRNGSSLPEKCYIIDYRNIPRVYIANTWPLTFQTLLLSSFLNPDSALTYIATKDMNAYDLLIQDKSYFLGPEWDISMFDARANRIKKRYFNLPDKGYHKLTTSQQNFAADSASFNAANIKISILDKIARKINDSISTIAISIVNNSGKIIPSIPDGEHSTYLSYHVYDSDGKLINWDNIRTTLETDIYGSSEQSVNIKTKQLEDNKLKIEVDFVTENQRWWGINSKTSVTIN